MIGAKTITAILPAANNRRDLTINCGADIGNASNDISCVIYLSVIGIGNLYNPISVIIIVFPDIIDAQYCSGDCLDVAPLVILIVCLTRFIRDLTEFTHCVGFIF